MELGYLRSTLLTCAAFLVIGAGCVSSPSVQPRASTDSESDIELPSRDITDLSAVQLRQVKGLQSSINVTEIREGGPMKDGIPSIDKPIFGTLEEADEYLDDEGLGILIERDGEKRYYPFQILVWHEIVNDTFNGFPIMVTYCPLCRTGVVYEREVNGSAVEFGVSGKLYQNNLLMYNRDPEQASLWSQAAGKAVVGPLTGTELKIVPSLHVKWKDIKKEFNDTSNLRILKNMLYAPSRYLTDPYEGYDETDGTLFPQALDDQRLPVKEPVFTIIYQGVAKAYPIEEAKAAAPFKDTIGNATIFIERDEELNALRAVTSTGGQLLPASESFWFSWVATHPDTELWQP
ncbi:DUF3179 domain-containing protein [Candidatus Uhrbacteria bacterium]|nr:DUF3179 domain-containing protein [Candidatus Uhrbacteria bacterium]MBD3283984.1 DUF3179 domain-containing protein [Candidatus Uhrbacteria bacterium]